MSPRTFRWALWLGAVLALPLPFAGIEPAFIPVGRQIMLAGITAGFVLAEGTAGVGPLVFLLFAGQALLWGTLLWGICWGFARVLREARPGFRQRIAFVLVAILVGIGVTDRLYETPYSATQERSTLLEMYR